LAHEHAFGLGFGLGVWVRSFSSDVFASHAQRTPDGLYDFLMERDASANFANLIVENFTHQG